MDVIGGGLRITAANTLKKLRAILVYIIQKSGSLLLKLPLASIRFLARIGNYLLDKKNAKVLLVILTTATVVVTSRALVNQANRKRLKRESSKLFSRFHKRYASSLNLVDADDDELVKAAIDLE